MLVDGMSIWAVFADYHGPDDMFFSRTSPSSHHARKRLNTGMVNKGVKRCAGRRGLDKEKYSTKSCKIGGISTLKAMGLAKEMIMKKMDHSSASGSRAYQRPALGENQGPLAAGAAGYLTSSVRLGQMWSVR